MYENFYGLTEKPFSILPYPDLFYWAQPHSHAYSMLEYGIMNQAGFTVITGEIGCGKTTLIRVLLRNLSESVTVGLITNTLPGSGRLIEWILMSLDQPFDTDSDVKLYHQFQDFVINEYSEGRHVVLIIDEAQNLDSKTLEELRMLSNINIDKVQLLQLILVGQPQLRDLLKKPELNQFLQRVSSDFFLTPLSELEVIDYINHRLRVVGAEEHLFSHNACIMIARASKGVPRTINILCDRTLVYGYSAGARKITIHTVDKMLRDRKEYGLATSA